MACDLPTTQTAACNSDIGKIDSPLELLKLIAQLSCEVAAAAAGNEPGLPLTSVQFNDGGVFGGDANFTFNKTTDTLTIPNIGSPAATALQFASAGTNRANFSTSGHLLWNTDNTLDIGASGATRPRRGYFGTELLAPLVSIAAAANANALAVTGYSLTGANAQSAINVTGTWNTSGTPAAILVDITDTASNANSLLLSLRRGAAVQVDITKNGDIFAAGSILQVAAGAMIRWSASTRMQAPSNGVLLLSNAAVTDFSRLQLGGTTSSFPAIKRSSALLQCRLADDSAYTDIEARIVRTTPAFTVGTLPAAGTAGRRTYVTDANATTYASTVAGGGANVVPVFDNGTNWIIA